MEEECDDNKEGKDHFSRCWCKERFPECILFLLFSFFTQCVLIDCIDRFMDIFCQVVVEEELAYRQDIMAFVEAVLDVVNKVFSGHHVLSSNSIYHRPFSKTKMMLCFFFSSRAKSSGFGIVVSMLGPRL